MSKLLHSLPAGYNSLKEAWDSVHPDLQTRSNLIARMLSHDAKVGTSSEPKVDVALVANNDRQGNRNGNWKKNVKCFKCGEK